MFYNICLFSRTLINSNKEIKYKYEDSNGYIKWDSNSNNITIADFAIGTYKFYIDGTKRADFEFKLGGVYSIFVEQENDKMVRIDFLII